MKVLIVGSCHAELHEKEHFISACQDIGAAFTKAGMELVIGSASENTADRYVLDGIASVEGRHNVWVVRPESGMSQDLKEFDRPNIQFLFKSVRGSWASGRVPQIQAADAMVVIGGGSGTLTCGYIAPALEKPVLSIPSFGGAAETLWSELQPYYGRLGALSDRIGNLARKWTADNAELAVLAVKEMIARRTFKTTPRLPLGVYMVTLVACLAVWVILFTNQFEPAAYSFFSLLALAGLMGSILRNNLRMIFDPTALFSWNELLIEIGAGLLLGFALALLYLVGALTVTGSTATLVPADTAAFQRVAVVMTLLGLGGGLMIEQAAERVRRWFLTRLDAPGG